MCLPSSPAPVSPALWVCLSSVPPVRRPGRRRATSRLWIEQSSLILLFAGTFEGRQQPGVFGTNDEIRRVRFVEEVAIAAQGCLIIAGVLQIAVPGFAEAAGGLCFSDGLLGLEFNFRGRR